MMQKNKRIEQVRSVLRNAPDGMTVNQITQFVSTDRSHISRILKSMPDAYIDRWLKLPMTWESVWCVVAVPENCPKPTRKK